MRLTENQLNDIIREELANLISEGEIDEKLLDKIKQFGRGVKDIFSKGVTSGTKIAKRVGDTLGRQAAAAEKERQRQRDKEAEEAEEEEEVVSETGAKLPPRDKKFSEVKIFRFGADNIREAKNLEN